MLNQTDPFLDTLLLSAFNCHVEVVQDLTDLFRQVKREVFILIVNVVDQLFQGSLILKLII